jgi:hypothetical protein
MPDAGEAGTRDQASPSWSLGCLTLLAAMLLVGAMISFFGLLRDIRPPAVLTVTTRDLTNLQDITLTGNAGKKQTVRWSLSASVQQLTFSGLGTAVAILPLPITDCQAMAGMLQASCAGHQVVLRPPATITWSQADMLYSTPYTQSAASLEVAPTRAGYVNLFAQGSRPPVLCFNPPPQTVKLQVTRGILHFPATVPGLQTTECDQGLEVVIGTQGARNSGLIEIGSVLSATVTASGPQALAQGFAGPIVLNPGGTTIIGSPSQVTMHAAGGAAVHATISTGTGSQSLNVSSGAADRVITSAGQLVPSEWARESDIVVPLFGAVLTLAVAVLSGAAQELMAWVKGLRPRFRRLDLWLSGRLRSRRASGKTPPPRTPAENQPEETR